MANAAHFRQLTHAILVGQPIGERPDSYQEARDMVLPNSRWAARYSTRFYDFATGTENLIRPDKGIGRTWEQYRAGRDPALEWALKVTVDKAHRSQSWPTRGDRPIGSAVCES